MQPDKLAGALRITCALTVVGTAVYAGYIHRSPWIILPMSLAFTVLYVAGKWKLWRPLFGAGQYTVIARSLLLTWPIQAILFGIFFLAGLGLGSLFDKGPGADRLTQSDWLLASGLTIIILAATTWINKLEATPPPATTTAESSTMKAELDIDPAPLTLETFFEGPHYSHVDYTANPDERTVSDAAKANPALIDATEARLGIRFPALLRQLYERQNGGSVGQLVVPLKPDPKPVFDDWRHCFAFDYCDLLPLEGVGTLHDSYMNWVDPDDAEAMEQVPENARHYIVLAQRYVDTTYLDYSKPGEPTVHVVDFDEYSRETSVHFDSFEEFFKALRRTSFTR